MGDAEYAPILKHDLPEENTDHVRTNRFQPRVLLDADFGYFTGAVAGDGWANPADSAAKHQVMLANIDPGIISYYKRIVTGYSLDSTVTFTKSENPHTFNGYDCKSEKYTFNSQRLAAYVREELGRVSATKQLPEFTLRAPEAFRWGCLSGLIDTDGTVSYGAAEEKKSNRRSEQCHVAITTKSDRLADDMVKLGHSLGLTATPTTSVRKGKRYWVVSFSQASIDAMKPHLDLQSDKKRKNLRRHTLGTAPSAHTYAPPLTRERLTELGRAVWGLRLAREKRWSDEKKRYRKRLYGRVNDAMRPEERGRRPAGHRRTNSGYGARDRPRSPFVLQRGLLEEVAAHGHGHDHHMGSRHGRALGFGRRSGIRLRCPDVLRP